MLIWVPNQLAERHALAAVALSSCVTTPQPRWESGGCPIGGMCSGCAESGYAPGKNFVLPCSSESLTQLAERHALAAVAHFLL